ncbi:MAG: glycosyltransferase family 4 protein [Chitinophaga sp.]|uniref:glycosyltransferase family 4 protein n=1 Tax=Chitinophaga sp. TaxID=1869181 RepID=UPI001B2DFBC7|nr:glycosyltransferase family 4 protein [Chitinophaga sp.]MBO9730137.1 glycosyltransferase family 4 protein [Chitinophaga sp.]
MRVLLLYDYPPAPGGLATQGHLLYQGLLDIGVTAFAAHYDSPLEKEWYYRWFKPDVVLGVGYWGHTPQLILHPQKFGLQPVPWLVADGYIANYQDVLNQLPLILVTSAWVKEMYVRDGIRGDKIVVLPVGCNTEQFTPLPQTHPQVHSIRESLGIADDELMLLTIGGDACSKGARETMQALSQLTGKVSPKWRYVCKVWPQPRTWLQNESDLELASQLGLKDKVQYVTSIVSRNYMPYLVNACDIYVAPSRLEGFGMPQVEAGACGKPVIGIRAMGMLDTLVHEETALMAEVGERIVVNEVILGLESGFTVNHKVVFGTPRTVDYRADVNDISRHLQRLMNDAAYRQQLGHAARQHVVAKFDYKTVARQFVRVLNEKLNIH